MVNKYAWFIERRDNIRRKTTDAIKLEIDLLIALSTHLKRVESPTMGTKFERKVALSILDDAMEAGVDEIIRRYDREYPTGQ